VNSPLEQELIFDIQHGVACITLNRPSVLNAISFSMVQKMHQCLLEWAIDDAVKVVVVRGAGDKAFCAGGDIRSLHDSVVNGDDVYRAFFAQEYALNEYIYSYPKPYIAFMDGIVMGGGMGISQGAKYRVVTERTRLAMPETGIGFIPDVGGSYFLSRCPGMMGSYLGLTGKSIQGEDAIFCDLADWMMSSQNINQLVLDLEAIHADAPIHQQIEALLRQQGATNQVPNASLKTIEATIQKVFASQNLQLIIQSLTQLESASPAKWSAEALTKLHKNSPVAMAVTLRMIEIGKSSSLSACFVNELTLVNQWMDRADFVEGIRALIIDKDHQPHWRYTLNEVTDEKLMTLFPFLYNRE
jgi:enoyl-CoA hydratase/carnithine racemase